MLDNCNHVLRVIMQMVYRGHEIRIQSKLNPIFQNQLIMIIIGVKSHRRVFLRKLRKDLPGFGRLTFGTRSRVKACGAGPKSVLIFADVR